MKTWIKIIVVFVALSIATGSFLYTNYLVNLIREIERQRVELWAEAYSELVKSEITQNISNVVFKMIESNTTIPVIIADSKGNIITYTNIDPKKAEDPSYLQELIYKMKKQHKPIEIDFGTYKNYIYYLDSKLLLNLQNFPIIQMIFIIIFLLVVFLTLKFSQKAEENRLFVGMAKETAHQLGTPISSLMAWLELIKISEGNIDSESTQELEKDIKRLVIITERFSRIGSNPKLDQEDIITTITETVDYLRKRTSKTIKIELDLPQKEIFVQMNKALFSWVIENLWKNALDAMEGKGKIKIKISETDKNVIIDFSDTGKGIPKRKFKTIFKAGYTSKKRGWGLGLTLAKRIIEKFHNGKIFVKSSEIGKGTTFRIILNKN